MRLLDLYSGAGGAAMGYHQAGFTDIVGVDIDPQPDYPFEFIQGDAIEYVKEHGHEYDFIHSSPPCQSESALTKGNHARDKRVGKDHQSWIAVTRDALDATSLPYVIENVQGSSLRRDVVLCGEMFGLAVIRHRYFELGGWSATPPSHIPHRGRVRGWRHGQYYDGPYVAVYGKGGGKASVSEAQEAMGIDWMTNLHDLSEAIPPAYTKWVGNQYLSAKIGAV